MVNGFGFVFAGFALGLTFIACHVGALRKRVIDQQSQIDDLKRELEELKRKE